MDRSSLYQWGPGLGRQHAPCYCYYSCILLIHAFFCFLLNWVVVNVKLTEQTLLTETDRIKRIEQPNNRDAVVVVVCLFVCLFVFIIVFAGNLIRFDHRSSIIDSSIDYYCCCFFQPAVFFRRRWREGEKEKQANLFGLTGIS